MGETLYQMTGQGRPLRAIVLVLVLGGLIAPILGGLWQTGMAAFGLLPALGFSTRSLDPWRQLLALPGLARSVQLTLFTGLVATAGSVLLAVGLGGWMQGRLTRGTVARAMTPFLALPHAALAVGLVFVLAPSGWIARLVAPMMGWISPPSAGLVNDPLGLALILGLMIKEMPFLLLVILSALTQLPMARLMAAGRAMGYGRGLVWVKVILPQVWPLIRLPVCVVLAYGMSTVDMAMILGPSNPPTLAQAVTRWFSEPDPAMILPASAGALLLAGLVAGAIGLVALAEVAARRLGLWWLRRGGRGMAAEPLLWAAGIVAAGLMLLGLAAILALALWSLAWRWPWPAMVPEGWSGAVWMGGSGLWRAFGHTLLLALASTALALTLALAWLEGEDRARMGRAKWAEALIYLPLLIPQIGFLYGLNVVFLRAGLGGEGWIWVTVIWAQVLFVFPYVMITLSDPWRALDRRLISAAAALGAGPWRRLVRVKLPLLLGPMLTAAAVGVAVSVAQYLPTLFMGAGRIATLTTEAVTLSSGSDRRVTGAYGSLQAALPLAGYMLALLVPGVLHRNRRGLWGGGNGA